MIFGIAKGWIYAGAVVAVLGFYWWNDARIRQEERDVCDLRAKVSQGAANSIDKQAANQSQKADAEITAELDALRAANKRLIDENSTLRTRVPIVMPSGQACPPRRWTDDELDRLLRIPDR